MNMSTWHTFNLFTKSLFILAYLSIIKQNPHISVLLSPRSFIFATNSKKGDFHLLKTSLVSLIPLSNASATTDLSRRCTYRADTIAPTFPTVRRTLPPATDGIVTIALDHYVSAHGSYRSSRLWGGRVSGKLCGRFRRGIGGRRRGRTIRGLGDQERGIRGQYHQKCEEKSSFLAISEHT